MSSSPETLLPEAAAELARQGKTEELAALLKHRNAHVNLIPMNGVTELPYHDPTAVRTQEFLQVLERAGRRREQPQAAAGGLVGRIKAALGKSS